MKFANSLIQWYLENKRDLPWRNTRDPYLIWLSEIMLQQTRVAQGMPYFYAFSEAFPTVFDLANASEERVLKLWQGLGYYSRARNLHQTAKFIAENLKGNFPENYTALLHLKGVGDYTAAAIASFSYDEAVPVVDGNVFRVLSRYFDIETDISSPLAKKEFRELAFELMPRDNPAIFNQAIMEFGALQCVPRNPDCAVCVFNDSCAALQKGKADRLPVKLKKTKVSNRYFNYIVFQDLAGNTKVQRRSDKGIWHGLYEFPLLETDLRRDTESQIAAIYSGFPDYDIQMVSENPNEVLHKLSHQHLHIRFWKVQLGQLLPDGIEYEVLKTFPFPIVIYNFIEKEFFN